MNRSRTTHLDEQGNVMPKKPDEREYEMVRACSAEIYCGRDLLDLFARPPISRSESGPKAWWRKRREVVHA